MKISLHSFHRTDERTKLSLEKVIFLLEHDAFKSLGSAGNRKYRLIYSPADDDYFISIVDKIDRVMVTLLKKGYRLPKAIKSPNARHKAIAKKKALALLNDRSLTDNMDVNLQIQVLYNNNEEYDKSYKKIHDLRLRSVDQIISLLREDLLSIAQVIDSNPDKVDPNKVGYKFLIENPVSGSVIRKFFIGHNKLRSRIH